MTETITQCLICNEKKFEPFLTIKDHFLSQEVFQVQQCASCGFKFINPRPDATIIGRYYQSEDYISHDSNRQDLISKIYKYARNISIRQKYNLVNKYSRSKNILDYGCGTGEFLRYCGKNGFITEGVEPNHKAREFAVKNNKLSVSESLSSVVAPTGGFGCITLWHVLEHVHDLNPTLEKLKDLLARDGVLVIAVPNCNSHDAKKYQTFWAAYDVPRHLYHFTEDTIARLAQRHNFEISGILPQKLDAFYVSLLSEKYLRGKNNFIQAFLNGLISNFKAGKPKTGYSSQIFILKPKTA